MKDAPSLAAAKPKPAKTKRAAEKAPKQPAKKKPKPAKQKESDEESDADPLSFS
jgi:ribosomal protein L12E/L44/L45/RPP1/RPP2